MQSDLKLHQRRRAKPTRIAAGVACLGAFVFVVACQAASSSTDQAEAILRGDPVFVGGRMESQTNAYETILQWMNLKGGKYGPSWNPPDWTAIAPLPESQRNSLLLAAAKTFAVRGDYPEWITATNWDKFVVETLHYRVSRETDMKRWAALLFYFISQHMMTTNAEVIPYLIEGLAHPDHPIASRCWRALYEWTGHSSGEGVLSRLPGGPLESLRQPSIDWWRKWWGQNKNKHPILDRSLEERVWREFVRTARKVGDLPPEFGPEMAPYAPPTDEPIKLDYINPLFTLPLETYLNDWWSPRRYLLVNGTWTNVLVHEVYLLVHAGFKTKDIAAGPSREKANPLSKKAPLEEVFSGVLKGTDIAVEVKVATEDVRLVRALKKTFEGFSLN